MSPRVRLAKLLSHLPKDGVNAVVYQTRWANKGLPVPSTSSTAAASEACRWDVKKVDLSFNEDGKPSAEAYGVFYWKGKRITPADREFERIKGASKYEWASPVMPPALVRTAKSAASAETAEA